MPRPRRGTGTLVQEPEPKIEEKGEKPIMVTADKAPSLADMSPEQREIAFTKWMNGVENKKNTNTAKRNAINLLKSRYSDEYDEIFKNEKVRLSGG